MSRLTWACCALLAAALFGGGIFYGMRCNGINAPGHDASSPAGPRTEVAPGASSAADHEEASRLTADSRVPDEKEAGAPDPQHPSSVSPGAGTPSPGQNASSETRPRPIGEKNRSGMPFTPSLSSFTLCKLGTGHDPTLLIIGGIQGDEPGGFSAAALVASHYSITSGSVWIVPDLNFPSIVERSRGLFGDMNRKFASLDPGDPEYPSIERIKSILLDPQVDLVLNLHDGSGFYRPTWEDSLRNPKRWGQSVIIDQEKMDAPRFNLLRQMAAKAGEDANAALLKPDHRYHTHNTNTSLGNVEMEKTLSYFTVRNGKPAFGLEASKEFTTEYRSYYHLLLLESFMRQMGIQFERDFELTPTGVQAALNSNLKMAAYNDKLVLQLDNIRPSLHMVPFKKNADPSPRASKPLLAMLPEKNKDNWRVAYGNRTLTRLNPAFMDFDDSLDSVEMLLDGKPHKVPLGAMVSVSKSFVVRTAPEYRVNAIGAQKEKNGTEAGVTLARKDFMPRFSLDKAATTYRVEVYKGNAFAGMVLVRFGGSLPIIEESLTATKGPESELGF